MRQSERPNRAAPTIVSQPGSGVDAHYDHGRPRFERSSDHHAGGHTECADGIRFYSRRIVFDGLEHLQQQAGAAGLGH
jgi:hypothetical protein